MSVSRFMSARVSAVFSYGAQGTTMFHLTLQLQVTSSRRGGATLQLLRFEQAACFRDEVVDLWRQSCANSVTAFAGTRVVVATRPFCTSSAT